jgi:hypothetical protein
MREDETDRPTRDPDGGEHGRRPVGRESPDPCRCKRQLAVEADPVGPFLRLQSPAAVVVERSFQMACPRGGELGNPDDVGVGSRDQPRDLGMLLVSVLDVDQEEPQPRAIRGRRFVQRLAGCDHDQVHGGQQRPSAGSGLVGLEDRAEALGGRFALESPPGEGTTILIELPLVEASPSGSRQ